MDDRCALIYKGHDRIAVHVSGSEKDGQIDEIQQYQDARWNSFRHAQQMKKQDDYYIGNFQNIMCGTRMNVNGKKRKARQCPTFKESAIKRGGTRKTFLYRALLTNVRSKGMIALATATSEVAAGIMPGGRMAH
ncbi:hypothetical protein RCOM_1242600 [Ricinus communis]|uniref:ATP-dependent DNA helicase n=1 Tax=Ricinus communis TaxID=3988 RepID=B9RSF4_RICCO|nr:hypothetical protein RCOM_1242600 [Ricinus communis]